MNDSQLHSSTRRTQRGVSLIEVLVVLVILVTGILTIIRLFPSGFFSIQSTGNSALADGLGAAAIGSGAQDTSSLPDAILPDNLVTDDLISAETNAAAYSNYDPDNPNNAENARVVSNETVQIPSATTSVVNGAQVKQSVYVVNYGPVKMPADPSKSVAALPSYFTVNSPYWTPQSGDSTQAAIVGSSDIPQNTLVPGQERFLVDLTNKMIAVPYAAYTPTTDGVTFPLGNGVIVRDAVSYPQKMVMTITCVGGGVYTRYLNVPAATLRDKNNPNAPFASDGLTYLADTASASGNYHGGWFDPTAVTYADTTAGQSPPPNAVWTSVSLYRPYNGLVSGTAFDNDPYEFELIAGNIGTNSATETNPGAVGFNPRAATGSGTQARKAQISYVVASWQILHEDHDIPALTGTGSTSVVRTTVPNLLLAGSANPDNSINPGIAGGTSSLLILDLDTGKLVAPFSSPFDPTNPDKPINNEDVNGSVTDPAQINVSYSTGRFTFGSNAFGDNSKADGSGTAPAHRIRIFYAADLNWTVAVQKAPSYFSELVTSPAETGNGTTALAANQFAYDSADGFIYFARCNAGKTVEIDGIYTLSGTTQAFSDTVSIDPVLYTVGDSAVRVNLTDGSKFQYPVPQGATVTFTAVRGLSARAVVAWKERNVWKEHSVDAVLTRTP
ncbi:MAG: prepilin-type N-terminal cleavage/methylation domain-containing protein [Janthinobacterium lividum]